MQVELSRKEILDLIVDLESQISPDDFIFRGTNYWPLLRIRLFMGTVERKYEPRSKGKTGRNGLAQIQRIFTRKPKLSPQKNSPEILFVSSQNYKVTISNRDMDRVLEAYLEDCREQNISYAMVDNSTGERTSSTSPEVDPSIFRIMVAAKALAKIDALLSSRAREVEGMLNTLESLLLHSTMSRIYYDRKHLLHSILYVSRLIPPLKKNLIGNQVGSVFFATGYDFLSLAMCAAADDIGVDTNIVQHGGQSENNAIFGRWTMLPKYGYEMLPDSYRCWDVVSSETINNWATLTTKHSAQTDGHRWIDLVSNNSSLNNDPHGVEQRASKYSLNIIVTLQPSAPQLIDLVVKVINSAPERVAWWVRVHPRQKSGVVKSELSTRIAEGKTILLDLASNAALPVLLKHMDLHLTAYSSTVYDALGFEVPTIFADEQALEYFSELLELEDVCYLAEPLQITECINERLRV